MSWSRVDELDVDPRSVRCYAEGWQSWSPTSWTSPWTSPAASGPALPADEPSDQPELRTMRLRPGADRPAQGLQAEGLLVVDPGTGGPVRTYAVDEATEQVASLRAELDGRSLTVTADGPVRATTSTDGPAAALAAFGDAFAARAGVGAVPEPPRVWCSWYRYFEQVTADDVRDALTGLDAAGLPVDVVQVDDGWSRGIGEWTAPSPGFGSLARLVDDVRASGRRAGIWLAPFLVGADTDLARTRPDWLTGDAGRNWGQALRGLDLTSPGVREHLFTTVRDLSELGVDYFKLDFLYAGAVPGPRAGDVSAVAAYRSGLALLREAAGPSAYLLGCGAPVLPSVGLVDAMRVSADTFHEGGEDGSTGLRGRAAVVARAWQHGRFWANDPDCLVTRPSYAAREAWAETVSAYGGLRSFSDRVAELDDWGLRTTRRLLTGPPAPRPFPRELLDGTVPPGPEAGA